MLKEGSKSLVERVPNECCRFLQERVAALQVRIGLDKHMVGTFLPIHFTAGY